MENKNKPAFPSEFTTTEKDEFGAPTIVDRKCYGLTKREYFAAMAMQGILSRSGNWNNVTDYNFIYREAVRHADALLKQLDTSNQPKKQ